MFWGCFNDAMTHARSYDAFRQRPTRIQEEIRLIVLIASGTRGLQFLYPFKAERRLREPGAQRGNQIDLRWPPA
jgi:hypothetical protein